MKNNIKAELLDLWETGEQEKAGIISGDIIAKIYQAYFDGRPIYALGQYVYKCLKEQISYAVQITYLPHPASRRPEDIEKLEAGLIAIHSKAS